MRRGPIKTLKDAAKLSDEIVEQECGPAPTPSPAPAPKPAPEGGQR